MTRFGRTSMTEQSGPNDLVQCPVSAGNIGFDFEACSHHFSPWLAAQGNAPNAWAVLGAVTQVTDRGGLFSDVTCPTMRYHPASVAQQAAIAQILAESRFTLGLGAARTVCPHWEAGFTDVALVQIGGETQEVFLNEAAEPLLAKLRAASN